jgi:hypothetical protein
MNGRTILRIISSGFASQNFLLSLIVGHRDGHSALWWECIVTGFIGLIVLNLVTFIGPSAAQSISENGRTA